MLNLMQYGSSDEDDSTKKISVEELTTHLKPVPEENNEFSVVKSLQICATPVVVPTGTEECIKPIDPAAKEVLFNPKYEELFAPEVGPENPFITEQMKAEKNMLSGYVEKAYMSDFQFENQRRTFHSFGYALDPSVGSSGVEGSTVIGSTQAAEESKMKTVFESTKPRPSDKRKRKKNYNPDDIDGFLGPWGGYVDEQRVSRPTEEEQAELEELLAKRHKRGKSTEEKPFEEKTILHIKDSVDYQGRTFLHAPQDVGVNLRSDSPPDRCFLPKAHIYTWQGHTKGISAIRWFPRTAHLLLSASMDCRIKVLLDILNCALGEGII